MVMLEMTFSSFFFSLRKVRYELNCATSKRKPKPSYDSQDLGRLQSLWKTYRANQRNWMSIFSKQTITFQKPGQKHVIKFTVKKCLSEIPYRWSD